MPLFYSRYGFVKELVKKYSVSIISQLLWFSISSIDDLIKAYKDFANFFPPNFKYWYNIFIILVKSCRKLYTLIIFVPSDY